VSFFFSRVNDYEFNWGRVLSLEGDTGSYLQYSHTRLASIVRKNPHLLPLPPASEISTHTLAQYPRAREIAFILGTYPDVLDVALKKHEPSGVVTFAFRLARAISAALASVVVKGEADLEKPRAKMYLYECAREVLAAAMRLLSIRPLEMM
jgi:arginyl-tRNA synthetase